MTEVTIDMIRAAAARLAGHARHTPLLSSPFLDEIAGRRLLVKPECLQHTGSFKYRGARNTLTAMEPETRANGVIAFSSGNHAQGVALAARDFGVPAVIVMPKDAPALKIANTKALGAEVVLYDRATEDRDEIGARLASERGLTLVKPFDEPMVIAGQGTIGLELLEDLPALDAVLVPLSGGGLIGGIALAVKGAERAIRVIGVSMEHGPAMVRSLAAGRPVPVEEEPSLADSLGGGIGIFNRYTFALARDLIDETILVSEDEIAAGMAHCYWHEQQIVEGAAAVGIAALLAGKVRAPGANLAVVLSGRNVDMRRFSEIVARFAPDAGDRPCPSPS
jgi:threonine dehydratase